MKTEMHFNEVFKADECNLLDLSDAKLHTDDGCCFDIFRIILARASSYFRDLFLDDTTKKEFWVPSITGESLSQIIIFIYKGEISFTESNITDIFVAAHYFKLVELIGRIKETLKNYMSIYNCLPLYSFVEKIYPDITRAISRFIQVHFEELVNKCSKLSDLSLNVLCSFISHKSLNISCERTIWFTIQEWVRKDFPYRQVHVPHLLNHLAKAELDETLATDIMEHSIVKSNRFCETLNSLESCDISSSNLGILQNFLTNNSQHLNDFLYRIPPAIQVVARINPNYFLNRGEKNDECSEIFVTYDENLDLWRKIADVNYHPYKLTVIQYNLFLYNPIKKRCFKFDLRVNQWIAMRNCRRHYISVIEMKVARCLYLIGSDTQSSQIWKYYIEVYNPETDTWSDGSPLLNIHLFSAESIDKNIYAVGRKPNENNLISQVYDTETQTWSCLPSPNIFRHSFNLLAYHGQLYIFGGVDDQNRTVEVFDPKNLLWRKLPDLPFSYCLFPDAIILNDQIHAYNQGLSSHTLRWIESEERWEKTGEESTDVTLDAYAISTLDDMDVIKFIWNENRSPNTKFVQCPLLGKL